MFFKTFLLFFILEYVKSWSAVKSGGLDKRSRVYENLPNITRSENLSNADHYDQLIKTQLHANASPPKSLFIHKLPKFSSRHSTTYSLKSIETSRNISLVLENLLLNYDSNQRPGHGGSPATISANMEIRSMGPISELDMEYSLDCYFRQRWLDKRLQFSGPSAFLSLNINMLDKIWKPDTYFHTGKGSYLHTITRPNKFVRIYPNGVVLYSMRLTIKSICPMQLHSFPMDKQSCPLIFGSYVYPNDQLIYTWDSEVLPVSRDAGLSLSQFDLLTTPFRNGTIAFIRGNYSFLQVNFNLQRHVGYFLIQMYVPCALIVVLSWVSFWINREATADRIALGVTAVLTLSTFGLDTRTDLPRVSYATALDYFTISCFVFVLMTILEFTFVHYFTKVGSGEVPVIEIDDDWLSEDSEGHENPLNIIAPPKAYQSNNITNSLSTSCNWHVQVPYCPRHSSRLNNHVNAVGKFNDRSSTISCSRDVPVAELFDDDDDDQYEDYDSDASCEADDQHYHLKKRGFWWSQIPKCFLQLWYCISVSEDYKEQMRRRRRRHGYVNSVSMIDKASRVLFPVVFILFNAFYWVFYWMERQSEFKMWQD